MITPSNQPLLAQAEDATDKHIRILREKLAKVVGERDTLLWDTTNVDEEE